MRIALMLLMFLAAAAPTMAAQVAEPDTPPPLRAAHDAVTDVTAENSPPVWDPGPGQGEPADWRCELWAWWAFRAYYPFMP